MLRIEKHGIGAVKVFGGTESEKKRLRSVGGMWIPKFNSWIVDDEEMVVFRTYWYELPIRRTWLMEMWDIVTVEHGLTDWKININKRLSTTAGKCRHRTKQIDIAYVFLVHETSTREQLLNTLLHEVAHALAGPKAKHSSVWKKIALGIGCDGARCHALTFASDNKKKRVPIGYGLCSDRCRGDRRPFYKLNSKVRTQGRICSACRQPVSYVLLKS